MFHARELRQADQRWHEEHGCKPRDWRWVSKMNPTPCPRACLARSADWSAKKLLSRRASASLGVKVILGSPAGYASVRKARGPGGPRRAMENAEHGVPRST
eukprot:4730637-Lingulodinium_polyedra.AAC.1